VIDREVVVGHELGLHARVSARLVKLAGQFESRISIARVDRADGSEADAKSILSILLLAASQGTRMRVRAEGRDESAAIEAVCAYLEAKE
jgi:phosphocarrier protein